MLAHSGVVFERNPRCILLCLLGLCTNVEPSYALYERRGYLFLDRMVLWSADSEFGAMLFVVLYWALSEGVMIFDNIQKVDLGIKPEVSTGISLISPGSVIVR